MERVLVIGCGGSGKTRLARTLAERLELPLVHLDREYWHPGWIEPAREDWEARVRELCAGERWIMDGTTLRSRRAVRRYLATDCYKARARSRDWTRAK